jgi:hypothetical protein
MSERTKFILYMLRVNLPSILILALLVLMVVGAV